MDNAPNRKNWLERNPKKVIGALVLLAIVGLALVTEKLLARKNHGLINPAGIQRYIKLREFNPLYRDVLVPNQEGLRIADGLAQKHFVVRVDRQKEKDARGDAPPGVDPDIAGIIPGPQPIVED
jgi:hypothetical protein